ncbi:PAS domain S-box protein [Stappia sp. GBMRC 2046]|uniref:histidine kinase n=1 Tax=Stappia sediminis TaxID=2692190 RepID=A0A7X3LW68_9HYPH|nr:PAS domain S-box protein [Stappia sediminis]MXN66234.1 PAS domain S-box protein [Stappia sediminis]
MDGLTRSYLALSGLAAASAYLTDERPAWLWAEDGRSIVWANASGAAFFGARSLHDLSQVSGLSRSPARPHIARIAASGSMERDSIERLRFYRGLRVMILTCFCRRMTLPGGGNAALIVAAEAPDFQQLAKEGPAHGLCRLLAGEQGSSFLVDRKGNTIASCGEMLPPDSEGVRDFIASGKRSPVFGSVAFGDKSHEAAAVALDDGNAIIVVCQQADTAELATDERTGADALTEEVTADPGIDDVWAEADASDDADWKTVKPVDVPAQAHADETEHTEDDYPAGEATAVNAEAPEESSDTVWATENIDEGTIAGTKFDVPHTAEELSGSNIVEITAPPKENDKSRFLLGLAGAYAPEREPPSEGFVFSRHGRPVRFAWKMDIDRRFTFISPEFEAVLGPQAADVVGRTWEEVAEHFGMDPDRDIAKALARRDTWSGRTVFWPVTGEALRVPVDMAALPAFDRRRVFEGFRGFGVCRGADATEDPEGSGLNLAWSGPSDEITGDKGETAFVAPPDDEANELPSLEADPLPDERPIEPETVVEESHPIPLDAEENQGGGGKVHASEDDGATQDTFDAEARPQEPEARAEEPAGNQNESLEAQVYEAEAAARVIYQEDASRLSKPEREAFAKIAETLGANKERADAGIMGARDEGPEEIFEDESDESPGREDLETVKTEAATQAVQATDTGMQEPPLFDPDETEGRATQAGNELEDGAELTAYHEAETAAENGAPVSVEPGAIDRKLLDRLPIGVAIIREPDVLYVNRAFLALLGHQDLGELNRAGGLEALFAEPEDWPSTDSEEKTFERTMRVRLADGGTKPVKARLHAVPWGEGHALMMSLLDRHDPLQEAAFDQLHMAQTALGEAEQQIAELDTVLETATDGVLVLDDQATVLKVNRSAEALFDAAREDMVGASLMEYLAPESHRDARDYIEGLAKNGVASVLNDGREVIGRVRNGGLIPLFMTLGRIGSDPDTPRFCAVLRDITQWKKAEEELTDAKRQAENASSQKSDFLAKISHEIRTPLNAIIGFSEVMMEERFGPIGNDRYKEYLRDIHTSGSHLMSLINDLLDLSKIEAGKLDLTFEAVSANDIIRECVALMQPQANRERVIIRASLPGSVPNIVADGRSVRQVILNLLSNAIKFNQPGGQVIVSSALEDTGEVVLRVRDTGIGMSSKDLQMALEPFRQLHTARHGGGTGLGLPLTKALVEANRAAFRIDSEPSHGTLVEITFPPQRVLAE